MVLWPRPRAITATRTAANPHHRSLVITNISLGKESPRQTVHILRRPGHCREIRRRQRIALREPRHRASHRMLHQRCESIGREPDQGGGVPYELGGRSGGGAAPETGHPPPHRGKTAPAPPHH